MKSIWSKLHITLKIGLILFLVGFGPLFIVWRLNASGITNADNALWLQIGLQILSFITSLPSIILIIVGGILTFNKLKKEKARE